jgi:hypothetical protein
MDRGAHGILALLLYLVNKHNLEDDYINIKYG